MNSYKGFNKDMTCRDFQYEEGKEYEETAAEVCETGFHSCEYPLDCFRYYDPAHSVYHEVEADGEIDKADDNTKLASTKLKIGAELSIAGLVKASIEYTIKRTKKEAGDTEPCGASSATGDYGASSATGYRGASSATGDYGASSATGDYGASSATGNYGASSATGNYGASSATGYRLDDYLIELSGERITSIEKPTCLGDVYYFEEYIETLRKCLKGVYKYRAFVAYKDTPDNCKLVTVVYYRAGSEPKWMLKQPQRVSKLWKRDIKRIISGYQAMIKQYKRALGGTEARNESN